MRQWPSPSCARMAMRSSKMMLRSARSVGLRSSPGRCTRNRRQRREQVVRGRRPGGRTSLPLAPRSCSPQRSSPRSHCLVVRVLTVTGACRLAKTVLKNRALPVPLPPRRTARPQPGMARHPQELQVLPALRQRPRLHRKPPLSRPRLRPPCRPPLRLCHQRRRRSRPQRRRCHRQQRLKMPGSLAR